jgi:hypothetical protein
MYGVRMFEFLVWFGLGRGGSMDTYDAGVFAFE